jgi:hypothetical protein
LEQVGPTAEGSNVCLIQRFLYADVVEKMMEQMMDNPMMASMLNNPDMMKQIMESNPQLKKILDANPQLRVCKEA